MEQHRRMTKRELINMIEEEYGEDTKFILMPGKKYLI